MVGGNENTFQGGAEYKGIHTNLCHEIGDGDARQGIAVGERAVTDGGNGIGDGDGGQGRAAGERAVANGGNRLSIKRSRNGKVVCAPVVLCNFYRTIIQQRILVVTGRERLPLLILRDSPRPAGTHQHSDHQQRRKPFLFHQNNLLHAIIIHKKPSSVNVIARKLPLHVPIRKYLFVFALHVPDKMCYTVFLSQGGLQR